MTTRTKTPPLFDMDQRRVHFRPPHWIAVARYDLDDEQMDGPPEFTGDKHKYLLGYPANPDESDEDEAVFDNWRGQWVAGPAWRDDIEIFAEGYARYDLRPGAAA